MTGILILMGLSAALIAAGLLFRWACWIFVLSLSFIFFQERSYYNNHIYLFILIGVLLSFTDADRFLSLRRRIYTAIPRWQQFILGAQVMIVYFYGGLTKLKYDWWARQEPVRSLVEQYPADHWLTPLVKNDIMVYVLSFGGLGLDVLAPLLLWYKPVRRWAIWPFLLFHLANSRIFNDIGIFPFVMLTALVLYFETPEIPWFRNWVTKNRTHAKKSKGKAKAPAAPAPLVPQTGILTRNILIAYFCFQLVFPFRGFFLPNAMDWTGIAKHFSWRMKVDTRPVEEMEFWVHDPRTGQIMPVDHRTFVNEMQIMNLATDARALPAFARLIQEEAARMGVPGAEVKARIRVRYNGRPAQYFIDPDVDLATASYSPFRKLDWVVPLQE